VCARVSHQVDLSEKCFTPRWWGVAVYAGVMAGIYTAGLPVLLAWWLSSYRNKLESKKARQIVGFLFLKYVCL